MTQRLKAADLKRAAARPRQKRKNKYGAEPVTVEGIRFDSKREANRYLELRLLQRAGQISDLRCQVPVELMGQGGPLLTETGRQMRYVADFTYFDRAAGVTVIEDAKGTKPAAYKVKKAVVEAMGLEIREV